MNVRNRKRYSGVNNNPNFRDSHQAVTDMA
jgi:hypothetical protein